MTLISNFMKLYIILHMIWPNDHFAFDQIATTDDKHIRFAVEFSERLLQICYISQFQNMIKLYIPEFSLDVIIYCGVYLYINALNAIINDTNVIVCCRVWSLQNKEASLFQGSFALNHICIQSASPMWITFMYTETCGLFIRKCQSTWFIRQAWLQYIREPIGTANAKWLYEL